MLVPWFTILGRSCIHPVAINADPVAPPKCSVVTATLVALLCVTQLGQAVDHELNAHWVLNTDYLMRADSAYGAGYYSYPYYSYYPYGYEGEQTEFHLRLLGHAGNRIP